MRTLIDLTEEQVAALNRITVLESKSRAAVIREAVDLLIAQRVDASLDDAFGLWTNHGEIVDGNAYQEEMRSEW